MNPEIINPERIKDTIIYFSQASNLLRTTLNIGDGLITKTTNLVSLVNEPFELFPVFEKLNFSYEDFKKPQKKLNEIFKRLADDNYVEESERFSRLAMIDDLDSLIKEYM